MADADAHALDELFNPLTGLEDRFEGYKAEIVDGCVYMAPQREAHWRTSRWIVRAVEDRFGMCAKVYSGVRIYLPSLPGGDLNGFAPDVMKLRDGAKKDDQGRWRHQDVEFVAEVISKGTAVYDYGPKKEAYALAEVPVYLIADPYLGKARVFTRPKDGDYVYDLSITYGGDIDLTGTSLDLTLKTDEFPRD